MIFREVEEIIKVTAGEFFISANTLEIYYEKQEKCLLSCNASNSHCQVS